jgi:hypothetical protein
MSDLSRSIGRLIASLRGPQEPLKSLYLPGIPRPKFPPRTTPRLPRELLLELGCDIAYQTIFPFRTRDNTGYPNSISSFNAVVKDMLHDRTIVMHRQLVIQVEQTPKAAQEFRLQYRFSDHLIQRVDHRLYLAGYPPEVTPYNFLIDLIAQLIAKQDQIKVQYDELGAAWLRLRRVPPYRKHSFFTDVTVLIHQVVNLIDIIYAETDDDIDTHYHYEWMSEFISTAFAKDSRIKF